MPSDYARIEKAILYLDARFRAQPSLAQVAAHVGLSEFHFQRLFTKWAGISPKRFLQHLTGNYIAHLLREDRSVLQASLRAGLTGTGRAHDLMIALHAATPGEWKARGDELTIRYGIDESPFGQCFVAVTPKGICKLSFCDSSRDRAEALEELRAAWPAAKLVRDSATAEKWARKAFAIRGSGSGPLPVHIRGTNFQLKVWEALLSVPPGEALKYGEMARALGCPEAPRAVGNALGRNPVAWLIPCHRVLAADGRVGGYRWGTARKKAILAWESARAR